MLVLGKKTGLARAPGVQLPRLGGADDLAPKTNTAWERRPMDGLRKVLLPFAGLLLLGGCGTHLQNAEAITPQGSHFYNSLYEGY